MHVRITILLLLSLTGHLHAAEGEEAVERTYDTQPPAPAWQTPEQAHTKSRGCESCHTDTDAKTMHDSDAVTLGCVDCHGGDASVRKPEGSEQGEDAYRTALRQAHVLPRYPESWNFPSSANPKRTYTLLNKESPEFVRFMNPSDYRVVTKACGNCHTPQILAAKRSLMATGAMFWGGAAYNNGILPYKNYILGEGYTREGKPAAITALDKPTEEQTRAHGVLPRLDPLPAWETVKPGDIFRVFEDGGRNKLNIFPETGNPNISGNIQLLERPGEPDIKQSNRGPGTGARIAVPVLNMTKTRLNDPMMWFMGTNDQPGDYRNSGCASCHVVYANDRQKAHSGQYAQHGHWGRTNTDDPTIDPQEKGHPLKHKFTRKIPTSQCMVCHMHQPNMFLNTYLGYTMWDYESDAPRMWPEEQRYPSDKKVRKINKRNPEAAAARGLWSDLEFLSDVWENNDQMEHTQFADYHGHGWNFRAVFKRDRQGNLLDEKGNKVPFDDPDKFDQAVHMSSIHLDKGMHCVDCHYSQDNHGNGHIYGEVASAVEIECKDCHGTADEYPDLRTSGPAAPPGGTDMSTLRNPDGERRFEWINDQLIQRSVMSDREWELSLVKDTVNPESEVYNEKAARAKLMSTDEDGLHYGVDVSQDKRAHKNEEMECYSCHTSWTNACGGCHLPIEANWKTERHHYEGGKSRNFATYNPQVVRTDLFMLGKRGPANEGKIAPTRSSSALVLSSTNANRERIYIQQPPISSSGYSSQAFNPHFPHTVRKEETQSCTSCHLSRDNDNNALMANLLMQGTDFMNFIGRYAWVGGTGGLSGVEVTEWEEPQAVYGSYLHKYAYPDWYQDHLERDRELPDQYSHDGGRTQCLQMRGEWVFAAQGQDGFRVYDIASIDNKGFSQRLITAPFSELGHDVDIATENATCMALPTTQPVHPDRNQDKLMREKNQEQPFHPVYNYAAITDAQEGLILTDVNTFYDGEFRNNNIERALTWNPDGILDGARHITFGGHYAYITTPEQLVVVNLDQPLKPEVAGTVNLDDPRASALQFRYLIVTTARGVETIDVTHPDEPEKVTENRIPLNNARKLYIAREYAYVAAGEQGLAIIDMTRPEKLELAQLYTAGGKLTDVRDVVVASTNASAFAYIADGTGGLKLVQLTAPNTQPRFYGYNPSPVPELIAWKDTPWPALALSKGLARARGVDETGEQISVFGRLGSRPLNHEEMKELYLQDNGEPWYVTDKPEGGWKHRNPEEGAP